MGGEVGMVSPETVSPTKLGSQYYQHYAGNPRRRALTATPWVSLHHHHHHQPLYSLYKSCFILKVPGLFHHVRNITFSLSLLSKKTRALQWSLIFSLSVHSKSFICVPNNASNPRALRCQASIGVNLQGKSHAFISVRNTHNVCHSLNLVSLLLNATSIIICSINHVKYLACLCFFLEVQAKRVRKVPPGLPSSVSQCFMHLKSHKAC